MCVVFIETSNTGMSTNSPPFPLSPPLIEKTALKCPSSDKQITDRQTDIRTLNNTDWQWHHSKAPPNCVRAEADYSLLTPRTAKRRTSRTDHWNSLPTSLSTCRRIYSLRLTDWAGFNVSSEWVSSVLRPHQHSIGYTGDGFYRSKDPTNSIKVLNGMLQRTYQTTKKTTKYTYAPTIIQTTGYTQNKHNKTPSLHKYVVTRGQLPQTADSPGLNGGGAADILVPSWSENWTVYQGVSLARSWLFLAVRAGKQNFSTHHHHLLVITICLCSYSSPTTDVLTIYILTYLNIKSNQNTVPSSN